MFENDLSAIRPGQRANIKCAFIAQPLHGVVQSVGLAVGRQAILDGDSTADTEARIVEVKILVQERAQIRTLTNARVLVEIEV